MQIKGLEGNFMINIMIAYNNSGFILKTENLMKEVHKAHNYKFKLIRSTIDKSLHQCM